MSAIIDEKVFHILKFVFRYNFTKGSGNDIMDDFVQLKDIDIEKYKTLEEYPLPLRSNKDIMKGISQGNISIYEILSSDDFWDTTFLDFIQRELILCYHWTNSIWEIYKKMNNTLDSIDITFQEYIHILKLEIIYSLEYEFGQYIINQYKEK